IAAGRLSADRARSLRRIPGGGRGPAPLRTRAQHAIVLWLDGLRPTFSVRLDPGLRRGCGDFVSAFPPPSRAQERAIHLPLNASRSWGGLPRDVLHLSQTGGGGSARLRGEKEGGSGGCRNAWRSGVFSLPICHVRGGFRGANVAGAKMAGKQA